MNITLWILQILLALHTVMGAVWKFSNPAQRVPSLEAIPQGVWLLLSVVELACAVCLVVPAMQRSLAVLAPIAALVIAAEMLLYIGVHLSAGTGKNGQLIYWLVVSFFCAFVAYGRLALKPL